jgi:hypothetical protein
MDDITQKKEFGLRRYERADEGWTMLTELRDVLKVH